MVFDFKKEYKEFYMPKNKPEIVNVPKANYIAVRGTGDPNEVGGAYQQAIGILYAVAYTLKMSYKTDYKIEGFFEYVVPPLEGFWWQDDTDGADYAVYGGVPCLCFGRAFSHCDDECKSFHGASMEHLWRSTGFHRVAGQRMDSILLCFSARYVGTHDFLLVTIQDVFHHRLAARIYHCSRKHCGYGQEGS